jgi:hypothetical protein
MVLNISIWYRLKNEINILATLPQKEENETTELNILLILK